MDNCSAWEGGDVSGAKQQAIVSSGLNSKRANTTGATQLRISDLMSIYSVRLFILDSWWECKGFFWLPCFVAERSTAEAVHCDAVHENKRLIWSLIS